ncbi:hypothetical protein H8959_010103 [Pygathrix nigripes]
MGLGSRSGERPGRGGRWQRGSSRITRETSGRAPREARNPPDSATRLRARRGDKLLCRPSCRMAPGTPISPASPPVARPGLWGNRRSRLGSPGPLRSLGSLSRAEEIVTKDTLFNAKQETSEETEQSGEASGKPNRKPKKDHTAGEVTPLLL